MSVTVTCATCGGLGQQLHVEDEEYDADGNARPVGRWVTCDDCDGDGSWEEEVLDERAAKLARLGPAIRDHLTAPGHDVHGCPWYCPVVHP